MSDLARLRIWDDPAIRDGLSWYLAVAENKRPAKFRIAATLPTQLDPATSSEEALWAELDRLTPIFLARWRAIRAGAPLPATVDGPSLLELCRELAYLPRLGSARISITLARNCFTAARKVRARFSSPPAT
jgi:putative pyruvate formate lyase activating enzyme